MKTFRVTKISKDLGVTHSAVSQWFRGVNKPSMKNAIKMNTLYGIPFEAWKDINSFISRNIQKPKPNGKVCEEQK